MNYNRIPDTIDLSGYLQEPDQAHKVDPARDWTQPAIDAFYKPDDAPKIYLPWAKTHADFDFRPGEVSLWGGINSHGKSQFVGQVVLGLMTQDEPVCIASLEMPPVTSLTRMLRQAWAGDMPSIDYIKRFFDWSNDRLWIYDHVGSSDPKTILAVIRYAVDKFKVKHFVVDNLAKVIRGEQGADVNNQQKDFVSGLCAVAHDTGVHVHLVLHVRKGEKESDVPGKFDIKGSGAITDLVDNVFIVWRNKAKEEKCRTGDMSEADDPDALLKLEKQRNKGIEGSYHFWFDPASCQYLPHRFDLPKQMRLETGIPLSEVEF
ncbi:DnaB-like helicase C-terminal domain-containing protein [Herbaspirillum sp. GCM10030257]|uniref:DnaB-like helicase C-terminal domain-containing protein n=1 Tax=Herbaspirillum sp. GCM10030257 TaxID=3273393 RepID=UPI003616C38F